MASQGLAAKDELVRLVYPVPGPGGNDVRSIARSVHGHVAHGETPEEAAATLAEGVSALA